VAGHARQCDTQEPHARDDIAAALTAGVDADAHLSALRLRHRQACYAERFANVHCLHGAHIGAAHVILDDFWSVNVGP
jgi:hypothetical protein